MNKNKLTIIGVDCATTGGKTGLCLAELDTKTKNIKITHALRCNNGVVPSVKICEWLKKIENGLCLITMDAPLGWPKDFGRKLRDHSAGAVITSEPNEIFRRETDRFIKRVYQKNPLEVGANLIARTAHSALRLIDDIRMATRKEIPLAWDPVKLVGTMLIEVYPAATLIAHDKHFAGKTNAPERMQSTVDWLQPKLKFDDPLSNVIKGSDHIIDAAICVLAGMDFALGNAHIPEKFELAKKEGWIWAKMKER